jgi:PAS domain S-box-containing protein
LEEAEATLAAIRTGSVDALIVSGPGGDQALAIEGATHPYHTLLNAMSDGAALLDPEGTILFCNRRLGEVTKASLESLRGSRFQHHIATAERPSFQAFLTEGAGPNSAREVAIVCADGSTIPVWIALSTIPLGVGSGAEPRNGAHVLMLIVTDLTERKRAEATHFWLMTRVISAEDDERRRIARELHDETGQSLTALLVGLRAIEQQATTADVRSATQRLRGVTAQTMDNVARLARGLHPSVLDDMGLAAAVRRHVSDYSEAFGIMVELRLEAIAHDPLPPLVQTTMYRIVQEALTNVARHARARMVGVEFRRERSMCELLVRDDGVGFDAGATLVEASGLGLNGMRERVALLGGSVEIESTPGHGTLIRARIPAALAPPETSTIDSAVGQPRRIRDRASD